MQLSRDCNSKVAASARIRLVVGFVVITFAITRTHDTATGEAWRTGVGSALTQSLPTWQTISRHVFKPIGQALSGFILGLSDRSGESSALVRRSDITYG